MRFRSLSNHAHQIKSPSGSDYYYDFVRTKDKNGVPALKRGCQHCISDEIAAAARGCDVESIVRRAGLGDPNAVLPLDDSMFADVTTAPKSLIEAEMQMINARHIFDSLPLSLRERYHFNPTLFMQSIEDGSYSEYIAARAKASDESGSLSQDDIAALKKMINGGTSNE